MTFFFPEFFICCLVTIIKLPKKIFLSGEAIPISINSSTLFFPPKKPISIVNGHLKASTLCIRSMLMVEESKPN